MTSCPYCQADLQRGIIITQLSLKQSQTQDLVRFHSQLSRLVYLKNGLSLGRCLFSYPTGSTLPKPTLVAQCVRLIVHHTQHQVSIHNKYRLMRMNQTSCINGLNSRSKVMMMLFWTATLSM
nr:uncharacterized protein LOC129264231 [Lytechinus pictus]